jgi:TetR/AcrR family transcriptional repressor of nem operon
MPRKASYNVEQVMSQAIEVFLKHGYHGATMDEIIAKTDFNRRAFYLEFTSKLNFLYLVLGHYQQCELNKIAAHLEANRGLPSILAFFAQYTHMVQGRGCLLINCITELGYQDQTIRDIGRHYLDKLQIGFIGCLEKAQRLGQLNANVRIEPTALQLTSYVQGFAVNAVLGGETDELSLATQALLDPLTAR